MALLDRQHCVNEDDSPTDSPTTNTYCYQLKCCVTIEQLSSNTSCATKKIVCRNATVILGRNQFREILLHVETGKANPSYALEDVKIHGRFIKDGRGSIEIPSKKLAIQMTNCAPDRLNVFLKSLNAKLELMRANLDHKQTPLSAREKLLSGLPQVFEKLSPLSVREIQLFQRLKKPLQDRSNCAPSKSPRVNKQSPGRTPKGKLMHRKRPNLNETSTTSPSLQRTTSVSASLQLTADQKRVLREVTSGKNVFFTGSAGTGKSLVLRRLIGMLPAESTFVTAATGVAACQIGGTTLHSFAGIGAGNLPLAQCLELAARPAVTKQWRKCTHLIIDEISMVDAEFFEKLEKVARFVRNNELPFGGIQLIVCGDFLQLPPVTKRGEERRFCFESSSWNRCITKTVLLNEVKRQDDAMFVKILQELRVGRISAMAADVLSRTRYNSIETDGVLATRLCTHTADANVVNERSMDALEGDIATFHATDSEQLPDALQVMAVRELKLKVGAQVMLTKNVDLTKGLSNGSRGVVKAFKNGFPLVSFVSGTRCLITPAKFIVKLPGAQQQATRVQVPLQLAWAISIHKSQGMTLDCVEMCLGRVFEDGQAYVALSRARSLANLRVLDFDASCVRACDRVIQFYQELSIDEGDDQSNHTSPSMLFKRRRLSQLR